MKDYFERQKSLAHKYFSGPVIFGDLKKQLYSVMTLHNWSTSHLTLTLGHWHPIPSPKNLALNRLILRSTKSPKMSRLLKNMSAKLFLSFYLKIQVNTL